MYQVPLEKMVCDTNLGDGGVYFYEDHLTWENRDNGNSFSIAYKDIKNVEVIHTFKKQVIVTTSDDKKHTFMLYKADTFVSLLYRFMEGKKDKEDVIDAEVKPVEDDLSKLERLAKLHDSGALTDEEFAKAKAKILG